MFGRGAVNLGRILICELQHNATMIPLKEVGYVQRPSNGIEIKHIARCINMVAQQTTLQSSSYALLFA